MLYVLVAVIGLGGWALLSTLICLHTDWDKATIRTLLVVAFPPLFIILIPGALWNSDLMLDIREAVRNAIRRGW
jgi:hypothetical protein